MAIQNSVLGNIVRQAYSFVYEGKYDLNFKITSPVDADKVVPASDFFHRYQNFPGSFIVNKDRLPVDPTIYAIVVRKGKVLLETARLDLEALAKEAKSADLTINVKGASVFHSEEIIRTRTQAISLGPPPIRRTKISLLPKYNSPELDLAIQTLDVIDHRNCFKPDSITQEGTNPVSPVMQFQQRPEMLQEIRALQTPLLLQTLAINQQFVNTMRVVKMDTREVRAHVSAEMKDNPCLEL